MMKKTKKSIFRLVSVMLAVFWAVGAVQSALAGTYNGGNGSAEKPYRISTPEDMNEIGTDPNDWDKHFVLTSNIDLAAYTGTEFNLIGYYIDSSDNKPFTGVFDGNEHKISNFTYTTADTDFIGLFGYVDDANAVIKDLTLVAPDFNAVGDSDYMASLVGWLRNGTITGCGIESGSVSGKNRTGGLIGRNSGTISNCYATGSITGGSYTGGLVGYNYEGTISNCYATGIISGIGSMCFDTGGLVGTNKRGTISNCHATGSVTGGYATGGLVGYNWRSGTISSGGTILNCYAAGNVSGDKYTGGLVGKNANVTISNCYATGSVTGGSSTGGLVGDNYKGMISASFWDIETGGPDNGIGTPLLTSQMQTETVFTGAGWDFVGEQVNGTDDIWSIHEGIDYPVFVWEIVNFVGWYEVDMADFAFFARHWMDTDCGGPDACEGTDIDFSGSVDLADLLIFTNRWLMGK